MLVIISFSTRSTLAADQYFLKAAMTSSESFGVEKLAGRDDAVSEHETESIKAENVITAVNKIVFEGMRSGLRICDDLGDLSFIGLDTESYDAPSSGIC